MGERRDLTRGTDKNTDLTIFRGKEAKLNRAILHVLGFKQPQTTREIGKNITHNKKLKISSISTVNKRVRDLEQNNYLIKKQVTKKIGGITNYYVLSSKAYLALFLDNHNLDEFFMNMSDETALTILIDLINTTKSKKTEK